MPNVQAALYAENEKKKKKLSGIMIVTVKVP